MNGEKGKTLSWAAIIVSFVALILAVVAVRRSGGVESPAVVERITTVQNDLENRLNVSEQALRARFALENGRLQLLAFRAELQAGRSREAVANDAAALRERLGTDLSAAQGDVKTAWDKFNEGLTILEGKLRTGASDTRQTLDGLIHDMDAELREL
jgi:hypothetical protein